MKAREPSLLARRVGERLALLGLSRAELARRLGTPPSFVSDLLSGTKQGVRRDALKRLALILQTSEDWLQGITDDPVRRAPPFTLRPPPRLPAGFRIPRDPPDEVLTSEERARRQLFADEDAARDREELAYDRALDELGPEVLAGPDEDRPLNFVELRSLTRPLDSQPKARRQRGAPDRGPMAVFEAVAGRPLVLATGLEARWTRRPVVLEGCEAPYAVVWPDGSLAPRVRRGEAVIVAPGADVRPGDDVVVVLDLPEPGAAPNLLVAVLVSARHHTVLLQGSDGETRSLPRHAVSRLHRVAMIALLPL